MLFFTPFYIAIFIVGSVAKQKTQMIVWDKVHFFERYMQYMQVEEDMTTWPDDQNSPPATTCNQWRWLSHCMAIMCCNGPLRWASQNPNWWVICGREDSPFWGWSDENIHDMTWDKMAMKGFVKQIQMITNVYLPFFWKLCGQDQLLWTWYRPPQKGPPHASEIRETIDVWLTILFLNSSICQRFGLGELSVGPFGSLGSLQKTPPFPRVSNDVVPASTQRCCPLRRLISSQRSSIHEPMRLDGPARVGKNLGETTYPLFFCSVTLPPKNGL